MDEVSETLAAACAEAGAVLAFSMDMNQPLGYFRDSFGNG